MFTLKLWDGRGWLLIDILSGLLYQSCIHPCRLPCTSPWRSLHPAPCSADGQVTLFSLFPAPAPSGCSASLGELLGGGWQPGWALAAQSSPGARHGPIAGRRLRCGSGADTSHYHTQPRPLQQPNPAPSRDGGLNPPLLTPSKHSAAGSSQPAAGWIHFPAGRTRILAQGGFAASQCLQKDLLPGVPLHSL